MAVQMAKHTRTVSTNQKHKFRRHGVNKPKRPNAAKQATAEKKARKQATAEKKAAKQATAEKKAARKQAAAEMKAAKQAAKSGGSCTTLYHATDHRSAKQIKKSGFRVGKSGLAGPGIYFSKSKQGARKRCRNDGCVVLTCAVKLGQTMRVKQNSTSCNSTKQRKRMMASGCASVKIKGQDNWCVYEPEQIKIKRA